MSIKLGRRKLAEELGDDYELKTDSQDVEYWKNYILEEAGQKTSKALKDFDSYFVKIGNCGLPIDIYGCEDFIVKSISYVYRILW